MNSILFDQVIELKKERGKISQALLMRKFKINPQKALRLCEQIDSMIEDNPSQQYRYYLANL